MKSFSQRKGYKPLAPKILSEEISVELRNSLWNGLHVVVFSQEDFLNAPWAYEPGIVEFAKHIWIGVFKKPIDTIPVHSPKQILLTVKNYFFECEWFEVYDFIEFVAQKYLDGNHRVAFIDTINKILTTEFAGYRFIDNEIVDITNRQETEMLDEALQDLQFEGVTLHLKRALELLTDRKNPDYRNSIKESISAVESMAKIVAENPKATIGEALKALEKNNELHPALKNGFSNLYGYTSDAGGIRHAMLEEPNITADDAKFFLLSCTSFVNYLKTKI